MHGFSVSIRTSLLSLTVLTLILLSVSQQPLAQTTGSVSPYSRYGIGDLRYGGFAENTGMGGLGLASGSTRSINTLNPASYSSVDITTFSTGVSSNFTTMSTSDTSVLRNNTSLTSLAFAFPVSPGWGTSIGLLPVSSVGYRVSSEEVTDNIGKTKYLYEGAGGLNTLYAGAAWKMLSGFSAGFNMSYVFGEIMKRRSVEIPDSANIFNTRITNRISAGGLLFNAGVQYTIPLAGEWSITTGIVASLPGKISCSSDTLTERYMNKTGSAGNVIGVIKDTIPELVPGNNSGSMTMPQYTGAGIVFRKGMRWVFGADAVTQNWSSFSFFGQHDDLSNSMHLSTGCQFTPGGPDDKKLLNTIHYRAGFHYEKTYLQLKGLRLNDYGFSLGAGIPLRKIGAVINIAVETGRRGTLGSGLIMERYTRVVAGFTFNDKWFDSKKFN